MLGIYNDISITSFLPQGNMRLELKRGLFLAFLVLITLFLSWSLFFTGKTNSSTFFVIFILFGMYVLLSKIKDYVVYLCVCERNRERDGELFYF